MADYAATARQARQAFISVFPFELINGGLGVTVTAGSSSSTTELVGEGSQVMIQNFGTAAAMVRFGASDVTATTGCTVIMPSVPYTLTLPEGATHVAAIRSGSTDTQINIVRGYGN